MTEPLVDSKPIGIGIVGLSTSRGWAAASHFPALAALDGYELRALSTSSAAPSHALRSVVKGAQDRSAPDEAPTAALVVGHEARTPMRDVEFRRRRPQRGRHDLAVIESARTARPGPVEGAADPGLVASDPPSDHRRARNPGAGSDLSVRQTVGVPAAPSRM
jgi:hypothetical protein